jgi:hypothetical protein
MICEPLDERLAGARDCRDHSNDKSRFQPDGERVFTLLCYQTADVTADSIADRAIHRR